MSISPRNLGGISDADTQSNNIQVYDFIRLDINSPVGTKCFTNKPCNTSGFITLNIRSDGSYNWYEYDIELGVISESMQEDSSISFLKLGNVDARAGLLAKQWTKWCNSPGLRGATVWVYKAQFNPVTDAYLGAYLRFYGELGGGIYKEEATITVKVKDTPFVKESPDKPISPSCPLLYRGPDCGFSGSEPAGEITCDFSRRACRARSNELNFSGFDRLPIEGTEQEWLGNN